MSNKIKTEQSGIQKVLRKIKQINNKIYELCFIFLMIILSLLGVISMLLSSAPVFYVIMWAAKAPYYSYSFLTLLKLLISSLLFWNFGSALAKITDNKKIIF